MIHNRKVKILLADDVPANLLALRAVLDQPNYEFYEASSGAEALELCRANEFALIVLDIQMPEMDGYNTALRIREETQNKDVPVIFVTATYRDDPHVRRGFEVGAIDYFGKPFDPEILRAKVGIYTDLYLKTKRLEETEELLRSHDQIQMLLEALPVGVLISDADGEIYQYNEEAARIWGVKGEVHRFDELLGPDSNLGKVLEGEEAIKNTILNIEAMDGTKRRIRNSAFPLKSKNGQLLGAVSICQELKQREGVWSPGLDLNQQTLSGVSPSS